MNFNNLMSDGAILTELGQRLARQRIDMQLTQADLAHEAGVSKRTVERIESGASAQISSIIRICRVLDLVSGMEQWMPPSGPRPMDLIKIKGKTRQRASSGHRRNGSEEPWRWDK